MKDWTEFLAWCKTHTPEYGAWINQHFTRHTQQGKSLAWIKQDIIKHFNTSDLMHDWFVEQIGEEKTGRGEEERNSVREQLASLEC
jgi:hypothetical protein